MNDCTIYSIYLWFYCIVIGAFNVIAMGMCVNWQFTFFFREYNSLYYLVMSGIGIALIINIWVIVVIRKPANYKGYRCVFLIIYLALFGINMATISVGMTGPEETWVVYYQKLSERNEAWKENVDQLMEHIIELGNCNETADISGCIQKTLKNTFIDKFVMILIIEIFTMFTIIILACVKSIYKLPAKKEKNLKSLDNKNNNRNDNTSRTQVAQQSTIQQATIMNYYPTYNPEVQGSSAMYNNYYEYPDAYANQMEQTRNIYVNPQRKVVSAVDYEKCIQTNNNEIYATKPDVIAVFSGEPSSSS